MKKLLVTNGDAEIRSKLIHLFLPQEYQLSFLESERQIFRSVEPSAHDALIIDLLTSDEDKLSVLHAILAKHSMLPVILITDNSHVELAIEAIQRGAANFVIRPFISYVLKTIVDRAIEQRWTLEENLLLKNVMKTLPDLELGKNLVTLKELEHLYIDRVLETVGGNITRAAKILGVSSRTLHRHNHQSKVNS